MAGDQLTDTSKAAAPANTGSEVLVAQAMGDPPRRTGRSASDEAVRGSGGTPTPAQGDRTPTQVPRQSDATPLPGGPPQVNDGKDVVLKLSYNDPKFDESIWKTVRYNTLEISDFPKGARLQHWKDDKGYFFWLTDGAGKSLDNKFHYYPGNVAKLVVDGKSQDLVAERKKVDDAIARRMSIDIHDGVLSISAKDPDFDKKLYHTKLYDTINIKDLPPGAKMAHGMDDKGFFFDLGDGKKHHYPTNAKQLAVDGKVTNNLIRTRYEVIEQFGTDKFGGFQNYSRGRDPLSNAQQVIGFAGGMDKQARTSLQMLDRNLSEAIQSSESHPYFKYLLANVKLAEAMTAVQDRVLAGQAINHSSVIDKIDECDKLLDQVIKESDGGLRGIGRYPRPNAPLMPLAPYSQYDLRDPNHMFYFWGGTWDQAGFMKPGVKFIRGLVESNTLGLPPARP